MAKYDIHNSDVVYVAVLGTLDKSKLSEQNKQLIKEFLKDAENGQHNPTKPSTQPVGKRKLAPYCYYLIRLSNCLKQDWTKINDKLLLQLLTNLKDDQMKKTINGKQLPYSEGTKYSMRILLKMFVRWLAKKHNTKADSSIIYIGSEKKRLPEYLTKEQVDKLVLGTYNPMYKAVIMTSFDAGTRIEELLNLKFKDIRYFDTKNGSKIMTVDIQVSKTDCRNVEIPLAQQYVEAWLKHSPKKAEDYLFEQVSYGAVRVYLRKLAAKVIPDVRVYPHLFRHSSATFYASRMNRQQLCKRYGWTFSSKMPDVYINRAGIDNAQVIEQFENESIINLKKQNQQLSDDLKIVNSQNMQIQNQFDSFLDKYKGLMEMEKVAEEMNKAMTMWHKAFANVPVEKRLEHLKNIAIVDGAKIKERYFDKSKKIKDYKWQISIVHPTDFEKKS